MRVYLGRAVSGSLGEHSLAVIQVAYQTLRELGVEVLAGRLADPAYVPGVDPPEAVARMMHRELRRAEAMVAEVSGSSTGVGYEIGWLSARGRPVLALYAAQTPPRSALLLSPPEASLVAAAYGVVEDVPPLIRQFIATARRPTLVSAVPTSRRG